jgi:dTDP-glucose pyrophosphorylase
MTTPSYPLIPAAKVQVLESASLLQAMKVIDGNDARIALVVNATGKLLGSLTDGDVRRTLIAGQALESPVRAAMHNNPFVMPASATRQQVIEGMHNAQIKQMPLIEADGTLVGIAVYDMITGFLRTERPNSVVIMAGGKGKRMWPLTRDIPKPMVEVGGKPMLEHIIQQFVRQGFSHFIITLNYLGHMIEEYFADGEMWGCKIEYVHEKESLGTAGALSLIGQPFAEPFVMINGDILTSVDFGELLDYHQNHQATATVCARMHRMEVPFGVLQMSDGRLEAIVEKPVYENLISAGIYVMEPEVPATIPKGRVTDMPAVLQALAQDNRQRVAVFPLRDDWMDVGRLDDLVKATRQFASGG